MAVPPPSLADLALAALRLACRRCRHVWIRRQPDLPVDQKIEEHYAAGDGHYAHGAELARYKAELRIHQAPTTEE